MNIKNYWKSIKFITTSRNGAKFQIQITVENSPNFIRPLESFVQLSSRVQIELRVLARYEIMRKL